MKLPLINPNPPKLSGLQAGLRAIEESGVYSNGGPMCRKFENAAVETLFGGGGACLAVANATIGLMIALRDAVSAPGDRRLVLMPAFTFAATAQAALWCGLTPLLCDSDPDDWTAAERAEDELLAMHGPRVAAILPYATFGADIDLDRYAWLAQRHDVGIVIDAAASLGTIDSRGRGFGTDCPFAIVYSMHATKTFAIGEGGLIYCNDPRRIETLRAMTNFGFESGRSATLPGINAKLSEVSALLALEKLREIDAIAAHRALLTECYRAELPEFQLQRRSAQRQAMQFMPVLLPPDLAPLREEIIARLAADGVGAGHYFSPHLAEQPYFQQSCHFGALPVADEIGARMLSLPITDAMSVIDVGFVCTALRGTVEALTTTRVRRRGAA